MLTKNKLNSAHNSSRVSRLAMLAGAAAVVPAAAHADSIVYSGLQNITADATGSNGDQTQPIYFVSGHDNSAFTFTAQDYQPLYGKVYVTPFGSGSYLTASGNPAGSDPTPLSAGALIGPSSSYVTGSGTITKTGKAYNDLNWPADGTYAYLGVSFQDPTAGTSPNGTYYGWIDVSAPAPDDTTFAISGWAYCNNGGGIAAGQTTGNCTLTPEPTSLGLLALGALGLAAVRVRRQKART